MAYRILIVDDQKEVSRLLRSALETIEHGLEVVEAPSGEEAILEATKEYGISEDKLTAAVLNPPSIWQQTAGPRLAYLKCLTAAIMAHAKSPVLLPTVNLSSNQFSAVASHHPGILTVLVFPLGTHPGGRYKSPP